MTGEENGEEQAGINEQDIAWTGSGVGNLRLNFFFT